MTLGEALSITFSVGSGRKRDETQPDHVEEVGWAYGIMGVVVLVVVQAGLLFWSSGDLGGEVMRDLALVAIAALATPFVLFGIVGAATGRTDRLPAAFLYMGLIFAALQLISAILSNFGTGSTGFLVGILGAISYLAARNFLKLGWPAALGIAILVVIGFMAAGFLLFALPSGRLFV
jgi:hypothetical protein